MVGSAFGVFLLLMPLAHAADGQMAEAAEAHPGMEATSHEQILQTIEAARASDPELAAEMERQLQLMESGDAPLTSEPDSQGGVSGESSGEVFGMPGGAPELIGPPVDAPANFEEVQADPRMQDIRQQFEGGQLSEDQAREKMFEVLRDHGVEPSEGREWEHQGEHSEGLERAFERMSTEGREQMEGMQRELESTERTFEAPVREYEAPMHEYQAPERMYETPEHQQYESQPPQQ